MPLYIYLSGAIIFLIFIAVLIVDKIKYKHVVNIDEAEWFEWILIETLILTTIASAESAPAICINKFTHPLFFSSFKE